MTSRWPLYVSLYIRILTIDSPQTATLCWRWGELTNFTILTIILTLYQTLYRLSTGNIIDRYVVLALRPCTVYLQIPERHSAQLKYITTDSFYLLLQQPNILRMKFRDCISQICACCTWFNNIFCRLISHITAILLPPSFPPRTAISQLMPLPKSTTLMDEHLLDYFHEHEDNNPGESNEWAQHCPRQYCCLLRLY